MTETTPAGLIPGDAWRYPELAVAVRWSERIGDLARARLIARGLAGRYTPESAVRYLLEKGEFAVAEATLAEIAQRGLADGPRVDRLHRELAAQRHSVTDDVQRNARLLRERAERIGWNGIDVAAVIADAAERRADGQAHLDGLEERILAAEERRGAAIQRELDAAHAGIPAEPGGESGTELAWRDEIRALLAVREFETAQQVLVAGPGSLSVLPVEQPVEEWPWTYAGLEEILGWFGPAQAFAPPRLRQEYVVDEAGKKLLRALGQIAVADAGGPALLADAVQELIGVEGVSAVIRQLPGSGHELILRIPDELRLPPMAITGRGGGLRMVIAESRPDCLPDEPVAWLSTRVRERKQPGVITLDLSDLLSLLQTERRHSGRPRSASSRRMGLIRAICRQLPVTEVLAADAFAVTPPGDLRPQVWWLLHAFGVSPDGLTVDTLLEESGARSQVLVHALHFAIRYARERGLARLEQETFTQLRSSAEYRDAVRDDIEGELGDEAAAALFTAIFFTAVDDLRSALDTIAADAELTAPVEQLLDVPRALERLRRFDYLTVDETGATVPRESGITRLLRRGDTAHELAKQALSRLAAGGGGASLPGPAEVEVQNEQFLRRLAEMQLHHEQRRARRAEERTRELLGETEPETETSARILSDRTLREERQKVEVWRNERVLIDLTDTCRTIAREVESFSHGVDILPPAAAPVMIIGSRMALRIALDNLICNAQLSAEENPPSAREVSVSVSLPAADPGHAWVDIEDNGRGMPQEVRRLFADGKSRLPSSRHQGNGEGLVGARELLRLLAGSLEVLAAPSVNLGGAHVRVRLPLAGVQASSGSH
jgi:signal transduction histidine kinase